jgi:putative salt-induced outer membrane protein
MRNNRVVNRWATTCMVVLRCLSASEARADHVVLTNHDSLTGTVAAVSKTDVTLDTDLAGRVTIKWSAVAGITATAPVRATLPTGQTVEGVLVVSDGRFVVRQTNDAAVPIDLDTLRRIELATSPAGEPTWHGALNAGVDVSRGNAETATVSTYGTVTRLGQADRLGLFGTYLFSAVGSGATATTTARALRGGVRYDHDMSGRLYGFGFGDAENDPLQLLDLRTVVGAGAGAHLVKTDDAQFNLFGGVSYARDAYAAATTATTPTTTTPPTTTPAGFIPPGLARRGGTPPSVVRTSLSRSVGEFLIGQDVSRQLSGSLSLTEGLTVFPAMGDTQDYRVSFDLSLSAQINGWLQWNVSVSDRYLHIPPAGGAVQNDTFISSGLGITFGNGANGGYSGADGRRATPPRKP